MKGRTSNHGGMTHTEIAKVFGCTESNIQKCEVKALAKMRRYLETLQPGRPGPAAEDRGATGAHAGHYEEGAGLMSDDTVEQVFQHVYPLSEEELHDLTEGGASCQCRPTVELHEGGTLISHNRIRQ